MDAKKLRDEFAARQSRIVEEWKAFLSIPSVSADPAFHDACLECADWVAAQLARIGFSTEVVKTETKPVVFGTLPGDASKPVVLFYGHYDVQPPDPLDLWVSPPFEPQVRDGRMYARGAEDNKGQLFYFVKAVEALVENGVSLPTIKVIVEGEEESGGKAINAGLSGWKDRIKADVLLVCDTGMVKRGTPTITMGLRGISSLEFRLHGARSDLHSGVFGGLAPNPARGLAALVASLHDSDGSVAVPGFYDGIQPLSADDLDKVRALPLSQAELEHMIGVSLTGGESKYSLWERGGTRPTLEVNGIGSGYQGAGPKTVIPNVGFAKLTMRLVLGQDP